MSLILLLRGIYISIKLIHFEKLILLLSLPALLLLITLSASRSNRYHFVIVVSAYPLIVLGMTGTRAVRGI